MQKIRRKLTQTAWLSSVGRQATQKGHHHQNITPFSTHVEFESHQLEEEAERSHLAVQ